MHRPPLPPGNAPGTHFCSRLSRPQGHTAIGRILCQWKIPMTHAGIEPATFQFVPQHLNHCTTVVPPSRPVQACNGIALPHLYISCSVYVGFKIKMDARIKFVGLLCNCNFHYSWNVAVPLQPMGTPTQPPWHVALKINIHYVNLMCGWLCTVIQCG